MKNYAYQFISRVRQQATPKKTHATITSGGRERTFVAYDWGTDTFIFERDVWKLRPERAPKGTQVECAPRRDPCPE